MATAVPTRAGTVPRIAVWDGVFVGLSIVHAVLLFVVASIPLIAIGLWWNANTISHNFIHRPFFRSRAANAAYSAFLSLLLGIPQSLWRARHLAHHAGKYVGRTGLWSATITVESILIVSLWSVLLATAPTFALTVYLPGYLLGLGLCFLQGHFEHARGTTSHYGRIYNALFFNDGYHVEHHERPGVHWTQLPSYAGAARSSSWPAVLRWLDDVSLESLERLVLRSALLQRFVISRHEQAFRRLLPDFSHARRITIVGGGLFPRTALILERLLPDAALVIVDGNAANLETARRFLLDRVEYRCEWYDPANPTDAADLVVIPLAFTGDRARIYARPPAPVVLVHDWIGVRHPAGVVVSWWLLKRINLLNLLNPAPR